MLVACPFIMVPLGGLSNQHLLCLQPFWYLRAWLQTKQACNCKSRTRSGLKHKATTGCGPYSAIHCDWANETSEALREPQHGDSKESLCICPQAPVGSLIHFKIVFQDSELGLGASITSCKPFSLKTLNCLFRESCSQPLIWFITFFTFHINQLMHWPD